MVAKPKEPGNRATTNLPLKKSEVGGSEVYATRPQQPAYQNQAERLSWEHAWERLDQRTRKLVALLTLTGSPFTTADLPYLLNAIPEEAAQVQPSPRLLLRVLMAAGALNFEEPHHYSLREDWAYFVAMTPEGSYDTETRHEYHRALAYAYAAQAEGTSNEENKLRLLNEVAYQAYEGEEHQLLASLLFGTAQSPVATALLDRLYLAGATTDLRAYLYRLASVPEIEHSYAREASRQLAYTALRAGRPTWSGRLFARLADEAIERGDNESAAEAFYGMGMAAIATEDFSAAIEHFSATRRLNFNKAPGWLAEITAELIGALERNGEHQRALKLCHQEVGEATPGARGARNLVAGDLALLAGKHEVADDLYRRGARTLGSRTTRTGLAARLHLRLAYLDGVKENGATHMTRAANLLNQAPRLSGRGEGPEHITIALAEIDIAREEYKRLL